LAPTQTGSFDNSGTPVVRISITGAFPDRSQEFHAKIGTGFTGFLSMPLVKAFPLAMILFGTMTLILADGSTAFRLGGVTLGGVTKYGIVVLEPSFEEVLLGMDFLKKFGKTLRVSPGRDAVLLIDDADMTPPAGPPAPAPPPSAPAP